LTAYLDGTGVVRVIAGHEAIVNLTDSNFGPCVRLRCLDRLFIGGWRAAGLGTPTGPPSLQ
jgi:hypothetical protein